MRKIQCSSPSSVAAEVNSVRTKVCLAETEESWDAIAGGISHLTALCNQGGCEYPAELTNAMRSLSRPLSSAICSERSRLSGAAIELVTTLAAGLSSAFDSLLPIFLPTLLNVCSRTNKVFTTRAKACIVTIIENTQLPIILTYLADAVKNKSISLRLTAIEGVLSCLNCFNPPDIEKDARAKLVEEVIKATARDANSDIRKVSKKVFEAYKALMPGRVAGFVAPLTPVVRKYLDISIAPADGKSVSGRPIKPPIKSLSSHDSMKSKPSATAMQSLPRSAGADVPSGPQRVKDAIAPHPGPSKPARSAPPSRPASVMSGRVTPQPSTSNQQPARRPPTRPASQLGRAKPADIHQKLTGATRSQQGPRRPEALRHTSQPTLTAEAKARTGGGARRVPLPTPDPAPAVVREVKERQNESSSAGAQETSRVPNAEDQKKPAATRPRSATNPTKSAAMRQNVVKEDHGKAPAAKVKPAWGQSQPGKPTKPLAVQPKSRGIVPGKPAPPTKSASSKVPATNSLPKPDVAAAAAIPLPPSPIPETPKGPAAIPLPASPKLTPCSITAKTPITELLTSIQQGFQFTPSTPLPPPHLYLPKGRGGPSKPLILIDQSDDSARRTLEEIDIN
ncbi:hypothetical protein CONPUDRAFT_164002 [Coniophora puteana RWD-64-598 SS2]|uniref:TOG domain-containing protein n=1 Tax=Coniophora puteana (strain RWD-64-598) TaxID=741705 RepID=A0A5M3MV06_CONPW|nr:uncharacterized protein CONPUDRAFT_164002 [Coniophora puteana RWD-64-598 SS2]EIW82946.1 hypothetical protein CONPUDRAFT_164002 [Coniophora puteana RWD-64-598 SS2]